MVLFNIPPKWVIQWPLEQRADEICSLYQLPKNQKQHKSNWSPNFTLQKWGKTQEVRTVCWKLDNWINLRNSLTMLIRPSHIPRYCSIAKDFILDTTSIYACHYSRLSLTCLGKHVKLIHPRMFYCNKAKASSSNFVPVPCSNSVPTSNLRKQIWSVYIQKSVSSYLKVESKHSAQSTLYQIT